MQQQSYLSTAEKEAIAVLTPASMHDTLLRMGWVWSATISNPVFHSYIKQGKSIYLPRIGEETSLSEATQIWHMQRAVIGLADAEDMSVFEAIALLNNGALPLSKNLRCDGLIHLQD